LQLNRTATVSKVLKIKESNKLTYVKSEAISLKKSEDHDEFWVQDVIANDPSILGLGDLRLIDKERLQPRAGRLDILLQDYEESVRYTVEIQLGRLDESHIIRAVEYWDLERKRFPQYDHVAVIIAEDITSRFLNVISLFNGNIPIIAIQMSAIELDSKFTLNFVKILDDILFEYDDLEEEEYISEAYDRNYWENEKSTIENVSLVDTCVGWINKELGTEYGLNYKRNYIGLLYKGRGIVPIVFKPRGGKFTDFRFEIKSEKSKERDGEFSEAGIEVKYNPRTKQYRFSMTKEEVVANKELLLPLFREALGV